jgi:hypothetical protein
MLVEAMGESFRHHYDNCPPFHRWLDSERFDPSKPIGDLSEVPFLPAPIFKRMELVTGNQEDVVRVVNSSGTSSQPRSRVFVDSVTRTRQMAALMAIMTGLLGAKRRPFIMLDAIPDSGGGSDFELSARIAGMRGYMMAASEQVYVMDEANGVPTLNVDRLRETIERHKASQTPFCLLGYTYILYQYVIEPLYQQGVRLELPDNAYILHFGGWKRLQDQSVSQETLKQRASSVFGASTERIRNIYGFSEQLGVIYPEDPGGVKRCPVFSEVFVRDPITLNIVPDGQPGLLEFVTPLPHSYPGVALLTDDIGYIVAREPGQDGWHGTGFQVTGPATEGEARGCGDTLPDQIYQVAVPEPTRPAEDTR